MTQHIQLAILMTSLAFVGCDGMAGREIADGNQFTSLEDRLELFYSESDQSLHFPSRTGSIIVSDLNGDELDDLVVLFPQLQVVNVGINRTKVAELESHHRFLSFDWLRFPKAVVPHVADLDGDGTKELLTIDYDESQISITKVITKGEDSFELEDSAPISMPECLDVVDQNGVKFFRPFYFEDVNGDSRTDLVCGSGLIRTFYVGDETRDYNKATVHLATPDDFGFGEATESDMPANPLAFGDFDGDGITDYVGSDPVQGALHVGHGDSSGMFSTASVAGSIPPYVERWDAARAPGSTPLVGDFNGDGQSDFFWVDGQSRRFSPFAIRSNGEEYADDWIYEHTDNPAIYLSSASRGEKFSRAKAYAHLDLWSAASVSADIDGDGTEDLVQLGWDRDFQQKLGPFIRVTSLASGTATILSNTRLTESAQFDNLLPDFLEYRLIAGRFYDNGNRQIIIINERTLGVLVYQWQ